MRNNIICMDWETGGKDCKKNPVIQFAGIILNPDLQEIARFERIIKPYSELLEYTEGATNVHGIDSARIERDGVTFTQFFKEYIDFLKLSDKKLISVAHNATFDNGFTMQVFGFNALGDTYFSSSQAEIFKGMSKAEKIEAYFETNKDHLGFPQLDYLDTVQIARYLLHGQIHKFGLSDICHHFGIKLEGAHDAMKDTEALVKMFRKLRNSGSIQERYKRTYKFQY